jgi:bis(5'-nucleosyl)-tetraphosphatase (symmetrical)
MSTYAIGDVQGCFDELQALLAACRFDPRRDRLWFVGDLVNRGPKSLEVLRFVRDLGPGADVVLGNHDLHLLCVAEGVARNRPDDTLGAVLAAPDRDALLDWLRARPLLVANGAWVMVHAGLLPQWSIERARSLADEVSRALCGPDGGAFLANLYGSRPTAWSDDLRGYDRLRVIVNAMTRMRFCTADGVMEFATKGEASGAPPGYMPWFDARDPAADDRDIVCGHWSALGLHLGARVAAIDTGCVWGGGLTALRLDDRAVFQVPCAGSRSPGRD